MNQGTVSMNNVLPGSRANDLEETVGRKMRVQKMLKTIQSLFIITAIIFLFPVSANAQAVVTLSPVARQQFFNASGVPLAGGQVYTYVSGTSTPQATYTDSSGLYLNSNPIQLDSGGFASIWLVSGDVYTIEVTDSSGSPQWTVNGVTGILNLLSPGPIGTVTPNVVKSTEFLSATSTPALTGLMRLASADTICWRNNANSSDLCINKNASDNLQYFTHPFAFLDTANTWNAAQTFSASVTLAAGGTFSGTIAGAPTFTGNLSFSGNPAFTGTGAAFSLTSNTVIPNLNASLLNGNTFASPGPIGGGTPDIVEGNAFLSSTVAPASGGIVRLAHSDGIDWRNAANSADLPLSPDINNYLTFNSSKIYTNSGKLTGGTCSTTNVAFNTCTSVVTLRSTEADTLYTATCQGVGPTGNPWIPYIAKSTGSITVTISNLDASAATVSSFSEVDCTVTR